MAYQQGYGYVTLPFIEQSDLVSYYDYFKQGNPVQGHLSADAAGGILRLSGLPDPVLAKIWSLSALSNGQSLTYPEFCLSMYLAKLARTGTSPPTELPYLVRDQVLASNAAVARFGSSPYSNTASPMVPVLSGNANTNMSRSSSFQTPAGVTVVDGFAGPMVVQHSGQGGAVGQRQQVPRSSQGNRGWAIDAAEKSQYDSIFKVWDPTNSGFINGDRAREIFMQSGLQDNILAHIWNLADTHKHGKLNPDEFAVAMHLVYKKLNGFDLPQTLPQELIPPSTRDLDALTSLAKTQLLGDIQHKKQTGGGLGSRTVSPFGSTSNLMDPLGTFGASPRGSVSSTNVHQERQEQERKRKELAAEVEARKKEIAALKEAASNANRSATELQKEIDRLGREVREAQGDVGHTVTTQNSVEDQIAGRGGDTGRTERDARDVEREIRKLLSECRGLEDRWADGRKEVAKKRDIKNGGTGVVGSGSGSVPVQENAQSKAAALLAASSAPVGGLDGEVNKIEEERRRRCKELDDVEGRVGVGHGLVGALLERWREELVVVYEWKAGW
ncbi:actin organization and endocytosis protein [Rhizophlyctis rosea]|uniref:Actin organization and endocytosis protein n=1 Tax=Rhizophlyctis rosea TaxID=64517 RepID=A0AAD5SAI3_9FUNG|nr:actin organization and endocytosis protein [Rhizophlyctis rosea]